MGDRGDDMAFRLINQNLLIQYPYIKNIRKSTNEEIDEYYIKNFGLLKLHRHINRKYEYIVVTLEKNYNEHPKFKQMVKNYNLMYLPSDSTINKIKRVIESPIDDFLNNMAWMNNISLITNLILI